MKRRHLGLKLHGFLVAIETTGVGTSIIGLRLGPLAFMAGVVIFGLGEIVFLFSNW
jgi:hypothetical protein